MYVQEIIFYNRAPFEHLHLNFDAPGVSVLTGINGKGKTTILSYIVDAIYEMARPTFPGSFVGKENKLYRLSSNTYNMDRSKPSFVYIRFIDGNNNYDYIDVREELSEAEYNKNIPYPDKIDFKSIKEHIGDNGYARFMHKGLSSNVIRKLFSNQLFTYFPSYRFEIPGFLNDSYKPQFTEDAPYSNEMKNLITILSRSEELSSWMLDIGLDSTLYAKGATEENAIWEEMNKILRLALSGKEQSDNLRFGIGRRNSGRQRVSIVKLQNGHMVTVSPNLYDLSSGEIGILEIFGEILRQGDNLHNNINMEEITGIVLIDEIDKNLHIKLQKEVLPKLLFAFPKIQFIVTSHSPFFNMGLDKPEYADKVSIFDLDNNGLKTAPKSSKVYEEVYEMFTHNNDELVKHLHELEEKIRTLTKPLVLTEGKTDIQFINKAKEKLGITIDYDSVGEGNQPNGDSTLLSILRQRSQLPNPNKIIGIFDRDANETMKKLKPEEGKNYKDFGNNVYGFCIPVPKARIASHQEKISIEYLFSDKEIKTMLPNHTRLFFGTEFTGNSLFHNENKEWSLATPDGKGNDKIIENTHSQAVYDKDDTNYLAKKSDFANAVCNEEIPISQESWENFRPIFDIISEILKL